MTCTCGRRVSLAFVDMWDYCPACGRTPFTPKEEDESA